jgi:hypothetical protein
MRLADAQRWLHEQIVTPHVPVPRGIAVYRHAYRERLLQTLRSMFPALQHALGAELFDAFALQFIERDPPRGYTLERLASRFTDHLLATRPDEPWATFIVELAMLECAFRELYDAPAHASREFRFEYPVTEYMTEVRKGESPALPQRRAEHIEVRRAGYRVVIIPLAEQSSAESH